MVTFSLISTCARGTTRMRGVSDKSSGVRASPKAEEFRKGLRTREGTRHKKRSFVAATFPKATHRPPEFDATRRLTPIFIHSTRVRAREVVSRSS